MEKIRRGLYRELSADVDTYLCTFCCYVHSGRCEDTPDCDHGLHLKLPGNEFGLEPGEDCWGFRPKLAISDLADLVGIIWQNGWRRWGWWKCGDGQIRIAGNDTQKFDLIQVALHQARCQREN